MSLIKPRRITLTRLEGEHSGFVRVRKVATWAEANSLLRSWSNTAPEKGGYDKCHFLIEFEDETTYSGRYDLKHWRCETPSLDRHVRGVARLHANLDKPAWMSEERWAAACAHNERNGFKKIYEAFLATYDVMQEVS